MTQIILLVAILAIVMIAVLAVYSADKKTKTEFSVPDGEFHIVRRLYGGAPCYEVMKAGTTYFLQGDEKKIAMKGAVDRFIVEYPDKFVDCHYAKVFFTRIKVDVRAVCCIVDFEKFFASDNLLQEVIGRAAYSACRSTKLEDLLQNGVSEVVVKDALLERKLSLENIGVKVLDLRISNVRDAYGKTIVSSMRRQIAKERGGNEEIKKPYYPSLEEVIAPDLDKL